MWDAEPRMARDLCEVNRTELICALKSLAIPTRALPLLSLSLFASFLAFLRLLLKNTAFVCLGLMQFQHSSFVGNTVIFLHSFLPLRDEDSVLARMLNHL